MSTDDGRQTFTTADGKEVRRPRKKGNRRLTDRYQALVDGKINVEDLDEEELYRGMLRRTDGQIGGNPPKAIPWVMHKAYVDHVGQRVERSIINSMDDIVESLIEIATGHSETGVGMDVRAKAQMYLVDRILGRATERQQIDVRVTAKWEEALEGGSLVVDIPDPDIIDVEPIEETQSALPQVALVERPAGREDVVEATGTPSPAPLSTKATPQPRPKIT